MRAVAARGLVEATAATAARVVVAVTVVVSS
jgi:hypothetical protein